MQLNRECVLPEEKEADQWSDAGRGDHPIYEVKNEYGKSMSISILQLYFGETWEPAMDRLIHQFDGYLMRIHYQGSFLKVYRKLLGNPQQLQPNLNLVKP